MNFRYDAKYHDPGEKTIFRHHGRFTWKDSCRLCVTHPDHPSFFVRKLWSYFVPDAAGRRDRSGARAALHLDRSTRCGRSSPAILRHPALYNGPRMVKPPVVYNAGLLAESGAGSTRPPGRGSTRWQGNSSSTRPTSAGWDDTRWLDTATWRGRWWIAQYVLDRHALDPGHAQQPYDAKKLLDHACRFWHDPAARPRHSTRSTRSRTARSTTPRAPPGSASSTP